MRRRGGGGGGSAEEVVQGWAQDTRWPPLPGRTYSVLHEPDPTDTDVFFSMEPSERCKLLMERNASRMSWSVSWRT